MIELKGVTKRYGAVEAIRDISFTAPKGQIVGLLGQNGAGKTTTLNILTGYIPPTEGQVLVDSMDLLTRARDCKRAIGYLPEKPPLYDEMTVRSYLRFVCELKEMPRKDIPAHVAEIIRTCTGMKYARTITCNGSFDLQEDLFRFQPTVFHMDFDEMFRLGAEFIRMKPDKPQIFYIWGHAYEFDIANTWERMEEFCRMISGKDDIFYGTNREVLLAGRQEV